MGSLFQGVKEFAAVLFQLLCYSRMGNYDFFNGALVLFVTLTVFGFPFLNPSLFATLRLGPWMKPSEQSVLGTLLQVALMAGFQFSGAIAAAAVWYDIVGRWPSLGKAVDNGVLYNNSTFIHGAVYNSLRSDVEEDRTGARAGIFFDEFVAQMVFMIGLIHIMEAVVPTLLASAAWQPPPEKKDESSLPPHTPIPLTFILCASLLVAGVTRAFPSAHQSPHISVFLLFLAYLGAWGIDTVACWLRFAGGLSSVGVVLLYYWYVYVDRGLEDGGVYRKAARSVIIPPGAPVFMRSELLLPGVFKQEFKP